MAEANPQSAFEKDRFPRNAWILEATRGKVRVFAGDGVEVGDGFLFEGAWTGGFTAQELRESPMRCGTGLLRGERRMTLVPSSDGLDAVYVHVSADSTRLVASNSMAGVAALAAAALPQQKEWGRFLKQCHNVLGGCFDYQRVLRQTKRGTTYRFLHHLVDLDLRTGAVTERVMHSPGRRPFRDFRSLMVFYAETAVLLQVNAEDPRRRRPYAKRVATISSGHDSAACCALMRNFGWNEAVTLRDGVGGVTDTGAEVGRRLGYHVTEFPRAFTDREIEVNGINAIPPESISEQERESLAEFWGTVGSARDSNLLAFESVLPDAILMTGNDPACAWDLREVDPKVLSRPTDTATGLNEFRLRVGFVHLPLPTAPGLHTPWVRSFNASRAMAAWSNGSRYDRPIPVRLLEEAGIPRSMYAQRKAQATHWFKLRPEHRYTAFQSMVNRYRQPLERAAVCHSW